MMEGIPLIEDIAYLLLQTELVNAYCLQFSGPKYITYHADIVLFNFKVIFFLKKPYRLKQRASFSD